MNDRELLKYWNDIPIGAKNAVSYEELSAKWHRTYRGVRKILELLSAVDTGDDYILIRSSHGRGFFRTKDRRLIHRYRKEIINRANNVLKPLDKIYKVQARIVGAGIPTAKQTNIRHEMTLLCVIKCKKNKQELRIWQDLLKKDLITFLLMFS